MNELFTTSPLPLGADNADLRRLMTVQTTFRFIAAWRGAPDAYTAQMRRSFDASGGMLSGDGVCALLRRRTHQPISILARWIVEREIVSFEACSQHWIPMFQFEMETLDVRPDAKRAIAELRYALGETELTEWFAMPNLWLTGRVPATLIVEEPAAVIEAARADRFVLSG